MQKGHFVEQLNAFVTAINSYRNDQHEQSTHSKNLGGIAMELLISSVAEACKFILDWMGIDRRYPGKTLPELASTVRPIVELNNQLGMLWSSEDHPFKLHLNSPGYPVGLLECQDKILDPITYEVDEQGIVAIVWENQGVWELGFNPSAPDDLWVKRDWIDSFKVLACEEIWRKTPATVEEGVIFALISNFCIMNMKLDDTDFDQEGVPPETPELLWRFQSWSEYPVFWTNPARSLIHYSGNYLTVRR